MKHLLAAMTLALTFSASAQTGLVEFPYNPDANDDDIIGITDLLELLGLFGSEFAEEDLYLNSDSTTAIYFIGQWKKYSECYKSCYDLPGRWQIVSFEDAYRFGPETFFTGENSNYTSVFWLNRTEWPGVDNLNHDHFPIMYSNSSSSNVYTGRIEVSNSQTQYDCYCSLHERPKVEYSYCRASVSEGDPTLFQVCCNSKVSQGWYPLSGSSGSGSLGFQAFWRWAE